MRHLNFSHSDVWTNLGTKIMWLCSGNDWLGFKQDMKSSLLGERLVSDPDLHVLLYIFLSPTGSIIQMTSDPERQLH